MGRTRKPVEEKEKEGTWRKDRDPPSNDDDIKDVIIYKTEPPPNDLVNEDALATWSYAVPILCELKRVTSANVCYLNQAFLALQDFFETQKRITAIYKKKKQTSADVAALKTLQHMKSVSQHDFDSIMSKFGLTPTDRAKLRSLEPSKVEKSGLDRLLS